MSDNKKPIKAFPSDQKYWKGEVKKHDMHTGMDLRDYFAARIMQGIFSDAETILSFQAICNESEYTVDKLMSDRSYELADAMLKARENG